MSPVQFDKKKKHVAICFGLIYVLPHVAVAKVYVALPNLRNGHVNLLIIGVKGH